MAGFEQTIIVGNVGRDPEMRYLASGAGVCSFSVAVTTGWTDKQTNEKRESTKWFRVSCWGRLADIANQYVRKGTSIMVVGTVEANGYMGQDGEAKASLDLRALNFQLLGGRGESSNADNPMSMLPPDDDIPF